MATRNQIYQLVNAAVGETLGETAVLADENLTNLVDVGAAVFNANSTDSYIRKLIDHVGKVVYTDRVYNGDSLSIHRDGWEFGAVLEKIRVRSLQKAEINESWELQNGTSYDPNIFTAPDIDAKYYAKRATYDVPISITEEQIKDSFSSAEQMNRFISMIYTMIENSFQVELETLELRTIDSMIADTIASDYTGSTYTTSSGVKAVNLLYLYNQKFSTSLTAAQAITTPEFIRFASYMMRLYIIRMRKMSTLYNIEKLPRFTPKDRMKITMLAEFAEAANVYLQSDVFHNELTALPEGNVTTVPYWQGSGLSNDFADTSKIDVISGGNNNVTVGGILGVLYDEEALCVCNDHRRVTSNYNGKAEFMNYWYKWDGSRAEFTDENFVVFFAA